MNDKLWRELVEAAMNHVNDRRVAEGAPELEEQDILDRPSNIKPLIRLHQLMKRAGYKTLSDMPQIGLGNSTERLRLTGLKLSPTDIKILTDHCEEIIAEERELNSEKRERRMFIIAITAAAAAVLSALSPAITALINYFLG
ncbi:MAG: hypothetical protein ISN29_12510 [Gammaproteobacteria bacterium AqS3]|nr:hypothetical protein [Gammaproteobacteria bacterium AqS3]